MPAPTALTGTPGTGKSTVARWLARSYRTVEVGELAERLGTASRGSGGLRVDLERLRVRLRRPGAWGETDVVVGHLAHLLPVREVVVLRCHPRELGRRLARGRRGGERERHENYVAEALDVVLLEALGPGRRVWEVDTTGRSPQQVARSVARRLRLRGPSSYGSVDWLADPLVTAHLLDRGP